MSEDTHVPELNSALAGRQRLLMHGSIIAVLGLLSGFGMVFAILESYTVWPVTLPIDGAVPGSERGWRVAHVAGVMNGLMMMIIGMALVHARPTPRAQAWIVWGMVYTGWGNTFFFHCANISSNRGLSGAATRFGEADLAGVAGYIIGASTIPLTITAVILLGLAARRQLKNLL